MKTKQNVFSQFLEIGSNWDISSIFSQAVYNSVLALCLALHLFVKGSKISQGYKPRALLDFFFHVHKFSPGHMHCTPDSLVQVEAVQRFCVFLLSLLLSRFSGQPTVGSVCHPMPQLHSICL